MVKIDIIKRDKAIMKRDSPKKVWKLAVVFVILVVLTVLALRENNLGMIERRNAVIAADETNLADLNAKIADLGGFVSKHMNTTLVDGIALQGSYDRAITAATNEFYAKQPNADKALYDANQHECLNSSNRSWEQYAACIEAKTGMAGELAGVKEPLADLYYVNFATPTISFDLAGILLILSVAAGVIVIVRLLTWLILHLILRFRYKIS